MAKKSSKKNRNTDVKLAAANDQSIISKPAAVPAEVVKEALKAPVIAGNVRAEAIRRTRAGKFTSVVLNQIGGKECKRFAPMTWVERDKFLALDTPEAKIVKGRYEAHLATIAAK